MLLQFKNKIARYLFVFGLIMIVIGDINAQIWKIDGKSISEKAIDVSYPTFMKCLLLEGRPSASVFTKSRGRYVGFNDNIFYDKCFFRLAPSQKSEPQDTIQFAVNNLFIRKSRFDHDVRLLNLKMPFNSSTENFQGKGYLHLEDDTLSSLLLVGVKAKHISLARSYIKSGNIQIKETQSETMAIKRVESADSNLNIRVFNSSTIFHVITDFKIKSVISSHISNQYKGFYFESENSDFTANVYGCTFDGVFNFTANNSPSGRSIGTNKITLNFEKSIFSDAVMLLVNVDTINFSRCTLSNKFRFIPDYTSSAKTLYLNFFETDIENGELEFTENMKLIFNDFQQIDACHRMFQSLLDKFKKEGKRISYEVVDIQYQQFKLEQYGTIGRFWSKIDKWWWNYGYNRNRIIGHTLLFLWIFYAINLILRKRIKTFYPFFVISQRDRWSAPNLYWAKYAINMFFLTLFIFFSIKVDLSKIDTSRTRMMVYFFVQYFTGLICLFFLINAIIRI